MPVVFLSPDLDDQDIFATKFSDVSCDPNVCIVWSRDRVFRVSDHPSCTHTNWRMPVSVDDKKVFSGLMHGSLFVPQSWDPACSYSGKYVVKPRYGSNSDGVFFTDAPTKAMHHKCDIQKFVHDIRTLEGCKFVCRLLYLWVPEVNGYLAHNGPVLKANRKYDRNDFSPEVQFCHDYISAGPACDLLNEKDRMYLKELEKELFERLELANWKYPKSKTRTAFDIYGLDILLTHDRPFLLEINTYFNIDWDDCTHLIADAMSSLINRMLG
jgi:hypothetical protein